MSDIVNIELKKLERTWRIEIYSNFTGDYEIHAFRESLLIDTNKEGPDSAIVRDRDIPRVTRKISEIENKEVASGITGKQFTQLIFDVIDNWSIEDKTPLEITAVETKTNKKKK